MSAAAALLLTACGPKTVPAPAGPALSPEEQFTALERRYVIFVLTHYPVVSTYLGGSEFDSTLADNDGKLRDYSADALKDEDTQLGELREQFTRLDPNTLAPRRRIDRNVALAEIEFLLHQHQVLRHQERALGSYVDEPFRGVDWQIPGSDIASAHKDALLADLQKAGDDAAAAYEHLRKFVAATFFDNPQGTEAAALKPDYRADRFAFGQTEYDWALHNNLRLDTTASDLFMQAAPIIVDSRDRMIELARDVARGNLRCPERIPTRCHSNAAPAALRPGRCRVLPGAAFQENRRGPLLCNTHRQ